MPTPNIKDRTVTLPQTYIGVDVAKDWIDVCDPASSRQERIPTDRRDGSVVLQRQLAHPS